MDWFSNNIVTIIITVVGWFLTSITTVAVMSWRLSKLTSITEMNGENIMGLTKALEEHEQRLDAHRLDDKVHTTQEWRQGIEKRFDRVEHSITTGNASIEAKIDRLTDRLLLSR